MSDDSYRYLNDPVIGDGGTALKAGATLYYAGKKYVIASRWPDGGGWTCVDGSHFSDREIEEMDLDVPPSPQGTAKP